jgi:TniQ
MTGAEPSPPLPLPIRPRPAAGEPASSYVRRLARANHLRPSYLHGYLAGPPDYLRAISPQRLAVVSGRTTAVLERTLTGLTQPGRDTPGKPSRRVTRAADKPGLFAAIRHDAHDGYSIRALAARHRVHRRTIRQALASAVPPPRKTPQRTSALDRLRDPVTAMLTADPCVPVRQVWERLLDEHDAGVSYAAVRDYVMRLRAGTPGRGT